MHTVLLFAKKDAKSPESSVPFAGSELFDRQQILV